jgi:hypothetical protein
MGDLIEPNNAVAQAMRDLQAARGVNSELRAGPAVPDVPWTDEEAAAAFARDTGLTIDPTSGAVIGRAEPARAQSPQERRAELKAALEQEEREEMGIGPVTEVPRRTTPGYAAGAGEPGFLIQNGVDLDGRVVVVDGEEFEMSEAEVKAIILWTNNVMANVLNTRLKARLKAAGIEEEPPAAPQALPPVRGKKRRR